MGRAAYLKKYLYLNNKKPLMKAIYVNKEWVKLYGDFPIPGIENFKQEFSKAVTQAIPFKDQDGIEEIVDGSLDSEINTLYPEPQNTKVTINGGFAYFEPA